ncbi:Exocyst complex component SEC6 [Nakaseomyces bracarensis]|uniref:Exocyst complex component SEC6 n=1 Tax=Nakaseomyces bracarensis TaxID=273131 RepID=A0ABR4NWD3_9SACH
MTTNSGHLGDLLKDELTIERIRDLKEQLLKEKSTIDYQLGKESTKNFEDVKESIQLLSISQKDINEIQEQLAKVKKLSNDSKSAISRYDIIFESTKIYEKINITSDIYDKIIGFNDVVESVNRMLDTELAQDGLETGCPYLLQIHYLLTMIRNFQDQMTVMANVASDDAQRTCQKLFSRVPGLIDKFDQLLESLIYDIVEMIRAENFSLVVRLFKIIDVEEREDLRLEAVRNIIKKKEIEAEKSTYKKLPNSKNIGRLEMMDKRNNEAVEYPTNEGLYREIMNGTITTRVMTRGYKNLLMNKIRQSIQDMFIEVRKEYQGDKRFEVLSNLDWVFNELLVVKDYLTKYTPPYWNIFDKYYEFYYDEIHILINELVESEPETIIILDIIDFDKTFQNTLVKDFGFKKKDTKTVIGEEQKETLFKDYLNLIVVKMTEWLGNLENTEFQTFKERTIPPHSDSENLLLLDGTKTCFQMFSQQVEVAAGSSQAKILVGVIDKFSDLIGRRLDRWISVVDEEVRALIKYNELYDIDPHTIPPENEVPGGLFEYVIALANDQMRAADYATAIGTKYGAMVTKAYEKEIQGHIDTILDKFADVSQVCISALLTIIFDDLKIPYAEIFSKSWYKGSQAQQISDTISEYLEDIRVLMNPVLYGLFMERVIENTILGYIGALKYEHSIKNKNNKFLECVKRDFEIFYKLFTKYIGASDETIEIVKEKFEVMDYFMDLCCEPVDSIIDIWSRFLQRYPDVPIVILEFVLRCRKDVDKSHRKKMVQSAIELAMQPQHLAILSGDDYEPSYLSNFTIKSAKKSDELEHPI